MAVRVWRGRITAKLTRSSLRLWHQTTSRSTEKTPLRQERLSLFQSRKSSLIPPLGAALGGMRGLAGRVGSHRRGPSNVLPLGSPAARATAGKGRSIQRSMARSASLPSDVIAHVSAFVRDRFVQAHGASLSAADLRMAYEAWCEANNAQPLSQQKLSAALFRLGYSKWKSCGLIRYRDLRLVA